MKLYVVIATDCDRVILHGVFLTQEPARFAAKRTYGEVLEVEAERFYELGAGVARRIADRAAAEPEPADAWDAAAWRRHIICHYRQDNPFVQLDE